MKKILLNDTEYKIIRLLGKGKGGYSYLVTDGINQYVIKQIHHEPCDYYSFDNKLESEVQDYNILKNLNINIPKMLEIDYENELILKEYIPGETALDLVINDLMTKDLINQINNLSEHLRKNNLNIDYFPTNFILYKNKFFYIDYECNKYDPKWNFESWGIQYWKKSKQLQEYLDSRN